jgi:hypothetical protein
VYDGNRKPPARVICSVSIVQRKEVKREKESEKKEEKIYKKDTAKAQSS